MVYAFDVGVSASVPASGLERPALMTGAQPLPVGPPSVISFERLGVVVRQQYKDDDPVALQEHGDGFFWVVVGAARLL